MFQFIASQDVDEQAARLRGWHQTYAQMSPGRFTGTYTEVRFDDVHLFVEYTSKGLFQSGELSDAVVALGVPLQLSGSGVFCGAITNNTTVHHFSGDGGFEFYSPADLVMGGVVISRDQVLSALSDDEAASLETSLDRPHLSVAQASKIAVMREFLRGFFEMLESAPRLMDNAPLQRSLRDSVVSNVTELLVDDAHPEGELISLSKRWQIVARARDFILSRPESPTSILDVCKAIGVSRRTLQYCFQDVLNLNPIAFLRMVRLNGVRRMLRTCASVSEAATYWGFWHFGHFSRDYKQLFGELPSETYRRFNGKG
ncbi:helix-turn-helix domain-containing protein [Azoarcus sp. KH32C]|uniref:helix-turn-helix domain-containing protein n=1 Tax=Azoarcus sp. KH32C TaxID=748247 RepID=UPI00034DC8C2|nr:helix-turn-helix domain-containing protein [Azoarcus sp. KH32C]